MERRSLFKYISLLGPVPLRKNFQMVAEYTETGQPLGAEREYWIDVISNIATPLQKSFRKLMKGLAGFIFVRLDFSHMGFSQEILTVRTMRLTGH